MKILAHKSEGGWVVLTEEGLLGSGLSESTARELIYELEPDDPVGVDLLFTEPVDPGEWRTLHSQAVIAELTRERERQTVLNEELVAHTEDLNEVLLQTRMDLDEANRKIARLTMLVDNLDFESELEQRVKNTMPMGFGLSEDATRRNIRQWMINERNKR
jgi:hypothetical protein